MECIARPRNGVHQYYVLFTFSLFTIHSNITLPPSYKYKYGCISALDEEPLKGTPYGLESQDTSETQEQ